MKYVWYIEKCIGYSEWRFFVTSEAIRQWFLRVTKPRVKIIAESPPSWQKLVFTVTHTFYFLYVFLRPDRAHKQLKQSSIAHFAILAKNGLLRHGIVTSPQFNQRRHANVRYWHCDVKFVDCSWTRKLAQMRSSLVNDTAKPHGCWIFSVISRGVQHGNHNPEWSNTENIQLQMWFCWYATLISINISIWTHNALKLFSKYNFGPCRLQILRPM